MNKQLEDQQRDRDRRVKQQRDRDAAEKATEKARGAEKARAAESQRRRREIEAAKEREVEQKKEEERAIRQQKKEREREAGEQRRREEEASAAAAAKERERRTKQQREREADEKRSRMAAQRQREEDAEAEAAAAAVSAAATAEERERERRVKQQRDREAAEEERQQQPKPRSSGGSSKHRLKLEKNLEELDGMVRAIGRDGGSHDDVSRGRNKDRRGRDHMAARPVSSPVNKGRGRRSGGGGAPPSFGGLGTAKYRAGDGPLTLDPFADRVERAPIMRARSDGEEKESKVATPERDEGAFPELPQGGSGGSQSRRRASLGSLPSPTGGKSGRSQEGGSPNSFEHEGLSHREKMLRRKRQKAQEAEQAQQRALQDAMEQATEARRHAAVKHRAQYRSSAEIVERTGMGNGKPGNKGSKDAGMFDGSLPPIDSSRADAPEEADAGLALPPAMYDDEGKAENDSKYADELDSEAKYAVKEEEDDLRYNPDGTIGSSDDGGSGGWDDDDDDDDDGELDDAEESLEDAAWEGKEEELMAEMHQATLRYVVVSIFYFGGVEYALHARESLVLRRCCFVNIPH
jgi:hypothetical protein